MSIKLAARIILLAALTLCFAHPARAQSIQVKDYHPRIWLTQATLKSLRGLVRLQAPTWNRLIAWAEEKEGTRPRSQDGPGLALAALLLQKQEPEHARRLGRLAVACALSAARFGHTDKYTTLAISEGKRRGGRDELWEEGYRLVVPDADRDKVFSIDRFTPTRVFIKAGGSLKGYAKQGGTYLLLWDDMTKAAGPMAEVALTLDWAYPFFSESERKGTAAWLVAQARVFKDQGRGCFDSASASALHFTTLAALAAWELHRGAPELLRQALEERFDQEIKPCLQRAGRGGGWFEGDNLGAAAGLKLLEFAGALQSAAGQNPLQGLPWYQDRLGYLTFHLLPESQNSGQGGNYRAVPPGYGDQALGAERAADLVRLQMLILLSLRPQDPAAGWAQGIFASRRAPGLIADHLLARELAWLHSKAQAQPLATAPLLHVAPDTGLAVTRSDWSELGTWISFNCGPHFAGAQHLAAGGLNIFKRGMLLLPGGVYDGYASDQAQNYAIRSLAHNTVLIYDPDEYSWYDMRLGPRPEDTYANDGGQRAWATFDAQGRPETIAPWTASGWKSGPAPYSELKPVYQVASLPAWYEKPRFAYLRGEMTRAYQGSTAKATRVVRHLVHLRPGGPQDAGAAEVVVVVDDITLKRPGLRVRFALNLPEEPKVAGSLTTVGPGRRQGLARRFRVDTPFSRLEVVCLYPEKVSMEVFGGIMEAAFWCDGANHPPDPPRVGPAPWRVEMGPLSQEGTRRVMVHCLLPAAAGDPAPPKMEMIETGSPDVVGLLIHDPLRPRLVVLRLGQPSPRAEVSYSYPKGRTRHLVAGLMPSASYQVKVESDRIVIRPGQGLTSSPAGVLSFQVVPASEAPAPKKAPAPEKSPVPEKSPQENQPAPAAS